MLLCLVCILQRVLNFNTNNANMIYIFTYREKKARIEKCLFLLEYKF
jgi:hypothetical protein